MHNAGRRSLAEALEAAPATSTWARIWLALLIVGDSGRDIQERAFRFACAVVTFCDTADDRRRTTERLLLQLFAAGTSIGANLAEASAGQTKPDFIAKTCVSLKEAREARYWLLLIVATRGALQPAAQPLLEEARELVKILTTIVKNARSNPHRG
jgi:four helix bundle protein